MPLGRLGDVIARGLVLNLANALDVPKTMTSVAKIGAEIRPENFRIVIPTLSSTMQGLAGDNAGRS